MAPAVDRWVGLAAAAGLVVWCLLCAAVSRHWPQAGGQLFEDARGCTAVLFLTAGLLRLAHWRVDGQAPAGLTGAAFVTLGSAQAVLSFASPVLSSNGRALASPVFTLATLTPVFVLLLAARGLPAVRADLQPARWALAGSISTAAVVLVLVLAQADRLAWLRAPAAWLLIEGASALLWAMLATLGWRRWRSRGHRTTRWIAAALALLALGRLLRAITPLVPGSLLLVAGGMSAISAGVLLVAAVVELCASYADQGYRAFLMSGGLASATERLRSVQQEQSERLHDARSAVLGALGASRLLGTPASTDGRKRLLRLMELELSRLSCSLDPDRGDPIEVFELTELVEPLLLAHRLAGGRASAAETLPRVRAPRNATATVLANVLDNVRRHAPGATAAISADLRDSQVRLLIDDDGPGVTGLELSRLGRRGERGSGARGAGSGFGLFNASRATAALGGAMLLGRSPLGGLRVEVWLPSADVDADADADADAGGGSAGVAAPLRAS